MRTLPDVPMRPSGDVIFTDSELGAPAPETTAATARNPATATAWRRAEVETIRRPSPSSSFAPLERGERRARGRQIRVHGQRGLALGHGVCHVAFQERQVAEVVQRV